MIRRLIILLLIVGIGWSEVESAEPYISPGIQIGFNSNKEFFYGFQLSAGILHSSTSNIIYSPSICFGLKEYPKSTLREGYIDLQMMALPNGDHDGGFPIGFGIGMNHNDEGQSNMRIKGYTWIMFCITLDYDIKSKLSNTSFIPVFPIAAMM